jgi:hypothetical protein
MKCLICKAAARTQVLGNWSEVECSAGCGHFRVSTSLVEKMALKSESFDVECTRLWLNMSRKHEPVPLISTYDFSVSLLHLDAEERYI